VPGIIKRERETTLVLIASLQLNEEASTVCVDSCEVLF
jgi:hypothetical protein